MMFIAKHTESAKQKSFWPVFSLWMLASTIVGLVLGLGVVSGIKWLLTAQQLETWGWRIPFLISIGGSFLGTCIGKALENPRVEALEKSSC